MDKTTLVVAVVEAWDTKNHRGLLLNGKEVEMEVLVLL